VTVPARTRAAARIGLITSSLSRRLGRGEGMVIGGRVILKLAPDAVRDLAGGRVAALVSATNGKTSTTRLLATAVEQAGPVISQHTGANMTAGVAVTLAGGDPRARAVLEVDEAYLPTIFSATRPEVLLLGNLSRDQLDRMNEVAMIARRWREMLAHSGDTVVVANADDPSIVWAARGAPSVVWVGAGQAWTADSSVCLECGALLCRDDATWMCPGCGFARPDTEWDLQWHGEHAVVVGPDGRRHDLRLQLPGRFNASNAALALVATVALGLDPAESARRMATVESVSGRYAVVTVGELTIRLLLAKNPAGWAELIGVMPPPPTPVIVTINANAADGRDPSWLWDVPFENLRGRVVVATGDRRRDLAVRLLHAGVDYLVVEDPYAPGASLPDGMRELDVVDCAATYTAFHHLRTTSEGR
jgi:UDP-N-acetylmuramyl tripeptide synthase